MTLDSKNTKLHYLTAKITDLMQPADSFVIKLLKRLWAKEWDAYKFQAINLIMNITERSESKTLPNPGKMCFSKLTIDAVCDVNYMKDK